jgi:hypothetical protein
MSYGVAVGVVDKTGRFEPPDHFVLGHLCDPWPFSARGSPQGAKRFIGLAIRVA